MTKDELTSVLGGWEGYSIENIERQDASNGEPVLPRKGGQWNC